MTAETQSAPVTIVFTDIVNSTQLLQRLGDERAHHVFDAHHHVLRDAILANGGDEVKWEGDGVMAAFASTLSTGSPGSTSSPRSSSPLDRARRAPRGAPRARPIAGRKK